MSRTNIEIDDALVREVMRRYRLKTKTRAKRTKSHKVHFVVEKRAFGITLKSWRQPKVGIPTCSVPTRVSKKNRLIDLLTIDRGGLAVVSDDQKWFWNPEWQEGEREASRHIAMGELTTYDDPASMFDDLDKRGHSVSALQSEGSEERRE